MNIPLISRKLEDWKEKRRKKKRAEALILEAYKTVLKAQVHSTGRFNREPK